MLTVMVLGPLVKERAGFLNHTLLVTLGLTTRNDLWHPVNVYAVDTDSFAFHVEQVKKVNVKLKRRVLVCKLELSYRDKTTYGLFVPVDDVWPFSDFARIDYEAIYQASIKCCQSSQTNEASVITLWTKP